MISWLLLFTVVASLPLFIATIGIHATCMIYCSWHLTIMLLAACLSATWTVTWCLAVLSRRRTRVCDDGLLRSSVGAVTIMLLLQEALSCLPMMSTQLENNPAVWYLLPWENILTRDYCNRGVILHRGYCYKGIILSQGHYCTIYLMALDVWMITAYLMLTAFNGLLWLDLIFVMLAPTLDLSWSPN